MDHRIPTNPRQIFSRIGLAFCLIAVIGTVLQTLWFSIPLHFWGESHWMVRSPWGIWLGSAIPIYFIAVPAGLLILRGLPAQKPDDHPLKGSHFLLLIPICFFFMYSGNLLGTLLSTLLSGGMAVNPVVEMSMDNHPLKIVVVVILAPLVEEYLCRKFLIDRTRQYGEKIAVLLSAVTFGLLHQNLFQFFYAFALGLLFAYIYLRTGRLRYSILLHGIVNFLGSVLAPWILSLPGIEALLSLDPAASVDTMMPLLIQALPSLAVYFTYALLLFAAAIAGLVLLILFRKKLLWNQASAQLPGGTAGRTVFVNPGMLLCILICLIATTLSLLP